MKVNDVLAPVLAADLDGLGQRAEVNAWQHDELGSDSSDLVTDVEQPVAVKDDRRTADVKNAIKIRHRLRSPLKESEQGDAGRSFVNRSYLVISC